MSQTTGATSDPRITDAGVDETRDGWNSGTQKMLQRAGSVSLVVMLIAIFAGTNYFKHETYADSYEVWNTFHYYLGAKYSPEVGYFSLYTCALEADRDSANYWIRLEGARDMGTYRIVPRYSLPPCPRANFTPERWSKFTQDVEWFAIHGRPYYFARLFADKGFNPPPSWVAVARPLAQAVPISQYRLATDIIFNLDVIAILGGVLIIWWSSGGTVALLTGALTVFYFGNFGYMGGNFLQYFWFPLVVVAIILWARNKPGYSGAVLGVATGLQVFPLFFGLPVIARGIIGFLRHRKESDWRAHFRFNGALVAVVLASLLVGSLAGGGTQAWGEWQKKITIHRNYLRGEIFDIGLANLTATAVSTNHRSATTYQDDVPNTLMRLTALQNNILLYYILWVGFLAMWLLAVVTAPASDLFGYGLLLMYAAVSSSPYYYLSLALIPFIFWKSSRALRLYAIWGTVALFAGHIIYFRDNYVSWRYLPHLLSQCSIALFLLGLAAISAFSRQATDAPNR